jgi:hypothetical protein
MARKHYGVRQDLTTGSPGNFRMRQPAAIKPYQRVLEVVSFATRRKRDTDLPAAFNERIKAKRVPQSLK